MQYQIVIVVPTLDLTNHNEIEGIDNDTQHPHRTLIALFVSQYLLFDTLSLKIVSFAQLPIIHAYFLPILLNLNHKMPFEFSSLISYLYFNILDSILLFFLPYWDCWKMIKMCNF